MVTAFEFEAAPLAAEITAGVISFELADADILRGYRDWAPTASDAITTILTFRTVLPFPIPAGSMAGGC